ncbi:sensor histidine kinase [Chitinophaga sp. CF118]|uniref:sensor histidine kinase n=1 Tax=Chitinophaga sp. CF118 TaxID=1884367 RepID=UPI0015A5E83C|nr:histidine kinase [Chitinophaga sp. CF118]
MFFWYVFASLAGILQRPNDTEWFIKYAVVAAIINTIILFLHDFIILRRLKIQTDLENSRLQTRNAEAENLLLKQQIQPHFLFNALNTLKVLYENDQKMGAQYLIQLADFLRVAVSHNHKFSATLEQELIMCKNYLNMQKIRFGESLEWDLLIENAEKLKGYIPSFSLQPLLENAIKHNGLTRQQPLKITIRQYDDFIEVSNNINQKEYGDISIKSGLSNLAERYYLLTGEEISVKNDGKSFCVSFKIMDNEGSNY